MSKCGAGSASAGGMHMSPAIARPCSSRQRRTKSAAFCGVTPAFCGSSPVFTCTKSVSVLPCRAISRGERRRELVAVERMDRVEQRHRVAHLVGLQRPDQVQIAVPDSARAARGHFACASCTRFSPNSRCPACKHRLDRLGIERLRHRDQPDRRRVTAGARRGLGDLRPHIAPVPAAASVHAAPPAAAANMARRRRQTSRSVDRSAAILLKVRPASPPVSRKMSIRTLQSARRRAALAVRLGRAAAVRDARRRIRARNTTCWRCSPIRPGASIWAMCATTRWATCSPASCARAASTSCTRWAGTPSACRPRTPPCRTRCIRRRWTYDNIAAMRGQLKSMGLSLDWSREFATCDVEYYAQQQRLFLDFLDAGLVARKTAKVNWDPVDQTVLANEQVIDGKGWRSGAPVEQRELTQWFFRITDYSEDLLDALDELDRWPDKVRLMQEKWIGRSEGLRIRFEFASPPIAHEPPRVPGDLHDAARHAVRRLLHGDRARPSARGRPAPRPIRSSPPSSRSAATSAPRRRRSRRRRSAATTPACRSGIRFDAATARCPSMSPTSS